jgi:flagellum-specific peptidoglycan hydrolase FlgJ
MAIDDTAQAQPVKTQTPEEFVKVYGPIAEQVGKEIGVDPRVILGKWGMETGWGKSTIGSYNLGNVKDVSKQGPKAYDKVEKSNDSYLNFESPQAWGNYYSGLIKRGYPKAVGAGEDTRKFTEGLGSGEIGSYYGNTPVDTYHAALSGGHSTASKHYVKAEENPFGQPKPNPFESEEEPNPFGEVSALPDNIDEKAPEKRPNLKTMPEAYQKASRLVRNREGDISPSTIAATGAAIGLLPEFKGGKGLAEMEKGVKDAKAAFELAKANAQAAAGASSETAQKLAAEASRLEQQYKASLTGYQALERELAESVAESKRFLPPETDARGKVAGESGTKTYTRVMPGQVPPEAMLAEVEDQTRGKNPRGKGAWDIADKNAANIETQKRLGMGGYKMTGTGSEQFVLGPKETARRQAQMDAAAQKAKQLSPQVEAARAETEASAKARETAEKLRQREIAAAQKTAREAQTAATTAETGVKTATQNAPSGIGKLGALAQKIPGVNILAGAGAGMSAAEALNRYEKGDTSGAVLSGIQVLMDGLAMLPPGTPITAALKGIGVTGGLATTAYDLYRTHKMEKENPPKKAMGGLTLMR